MIAGRIRMRVQPFVHWLPAIAWAVLILLFSGDQASAGLTEGLVRRLLPSAGHDTVFYINYGLRKGGHLAAYAVLASLNFRAIRGSRAGWRLSWSVTAVGLAVAVAILDEFRQSGSPARTGTAADVGLDFCGAALSQLFQRRGK